MHIVAFANIVFKMIVAPKQALGLIGRYIGIDLIRQQVATISQIKIESQEPRSG